MLLRFQPGHLEVGWQDAYDAHWTAVDLDELVQNGGVPVVAVQPETIGEQRDVRRVRAIFFG
jgi:hypothetical protein